MSSTRKKISPEGREKFDKLPDPCYIIPQVAGFRVFRLNSFLFQEEKMAAKIDQDKCVGCEACVGSCPVGAIIMNDGKATVKEDECVSCGACAGECPSEAITVE